MKPLTIKKMVPKFDTDAICFGLPYRIILNGKAYVGVFYLIDEDRLEFKYFEDDKIKFVIMLPTVDDIEIYPCKSLSNEVEPEKPVEEDEPDIRSFYIHDINNELRLDEIFYPLYVKTKYGWRINDDIITKLKESDIKSWEVGFGYGGNSGGCTKGIFKSNEISLAPRNTMLCAYRKINSDTEMSIEIDIDWKSIRYAYIKVR